METKTSNRKSQSLSTKSKELILQAARGIRLGHSSMTSMLITDAILRISSKYFTHDPEAREVVHICDHIRDEFSYLTLDELELAVKLALRDEIEMPYRPRAINIEFTSKLLRAYSGASYTIKQPKQVQQTTKDMAAEYRIWVRHTLENGWFTLPADKVEMVDHLIESKTISEPEGWSGLSFTDKFTNAGGILRWWVRTCHPKEVILDECPNDFGGGRGNLRMGIEAKKKQYLEACRKQ